MKLTSWPMLMVLFVLSACSSALAPGKSTGECDENPDDCLSVQQAMRQSDGPRTPPPSRAAIESGQVMQVWVPPTRQAGNGPLNVSGYYYVE